MRTSQMMEEVIPLQRNTGEKGQTLHRGESRGQMERVCFKPQWEIYFVIDQGLVLIKPGIDLRSIRTLK